MLDYQKKWLKYAINDWQEMRQSNSNVTYLVSFPKSGRTWLCFMLSEMLIKAYDIELEKSTVHLNKLTKKYHQLPRIIETHEDSMLTNEQGKNCDIERLFIYGGRLKYLNNKVILLVRDPRDVVVSHYYQIKNRVKDCPIQVTSLTEFVRHPLYGFERIIRFYQIWNRNRWIPKQFLMIKYEDLVINGVDTLQKIIEFIELKKIDYDLIKNVYQLSEADNMRKMELQGQIEGMKFLDTDRNSLKVRNAKIGSYLEELSDEDINYCKALMGKLPQIYRYSYLHKNS
ncbi:MAG: sulfotransferase domain-containing protein [Crocosphaera sp.]|nr:sulfotransferase domain-containing protein [Crocosphaera sp.]